MPPSKVALLIRIRFRWVECQLQALRDCETRKSVKRTLDGLPEDLDATYNRILENMCGEDEREIAQCALKLIAVSCRPMNLEEMSEALAVDCKINTIDDEEG